jgi:hypothetical protein
MASFDQIKEKIDTDKKGIDLNDYKEFLAIPANRDMIRKTESSNALYNIKDTDPDSYSNLCTFACESL